MYASGDEMVVAVAKKEHPRHAKTYTLKLRYSPSGKDKGVVDATLGFTQGYKELKKPFSLRELTNGFGRCLRDPDDPDVFEKFAQDLTNQAFPEEILKKLGKLSERTSEKQTLYLDIDAELNDLPWECVLLSSLSEADTIGTSFVVLRRYRWRIAPNLERKERLAMFFGDEFSRWDTEQKYSSLVQAWIPSEEAEEAKKARKAKEAKESLRHAMRKYGAVLLVAHGEKEGEKIHVFKSEEGDIDQAYYIGTEDYDWENSSAVLYETAPIVIADVCYSAKAARGTGFFASTTAMWVTCIENGTRVFVGHLTKAPRMNMDGAWFPYQMLEHLFSGEEKTLGEAVLKARTEAPSVDCRGRLSVHNYVSAVYVASSVSADETAKQLVTEHKASLPWSTLVACVAGGLTGVLLTLVCDWWFWVHLDPVMWGLFGALLFTIIDSLTTCYPMLRRSLYRRIQRPPPRSGG
jgi:hypothetical protein